MGLSHRFDQVLSFVFGHVTQSCSCAPAIAGVRWIRSSVQVRFSSRLTIERLEGHACAVLTTALSAHVILLLSSWSMPQLDAFLKARLLHREPPVPSCQKVLLLEGVFSGEAYEG